MECGECNVCCILPSIEELEKPVNTACANLCDKRCSIYDSRPTECSGFNCMYLEGTNLPIELRPDKCGIMFAKLDDKIIHGAVDPENKPTKKAEKQVHSFMTQGFSVVLSSLNMEGNGFYISPKHKEEDIKEDYFNHIKERYGYLRN